MHLLLLPGMDGTGKLFEPLLARLPASLPAVAAAYPGDRAWGYAELLPLVEAAVPAGSDFVVLGESFSGPLALLLAARQPPGLRGCILCASFVRSPLPASARWLQGLIRPFLFRATPQALTRWALLGRHQDGLLPELLRSALASVRPDVLAARARAILAIDVGAQLRSCAVPLLYMSATRDRVVRPVSLRHILRLRPDVQTAALEGPHLLLQAAPEEAASVIQAFTASCEACQP